MVASASWNAWSQSRSPTAQNLTPVVAVGLGTKGDNGPGTLQQIAAGAHDDTYRGIAQAYENAGYKTIDMRIGWEMNGNYMPWSMGNTTDSVNQWKAAFAHVADVVHSVSGIKVNVVWNPNESNNNQDRRQRGLSLAMTRSTSSALMSTARLTNTTQASATRSITTIPVPASTIRTAHRRPNGASPRPSPWPPAHGKPVGIGETGVGVGDNTDLPGTIACRLLGTGRPAAGLRQCLGRGDRRGGLAVHRRARPSRRPSLGRSVCQRHHQQRARPGQRPGQRPSQLPRPARQARRARTRTPARTPAPACPSARRPSAPTAVR